MNITNSFALILISLGLFFLLGKPAFSNISALKTEKQEYRTAIEQINLFENKKNELITKLNNIPASDRQRIETFLPTKERIIRLITDIDGIASKHGISIASADSGEPRTDLSRSVSELPEQKIYNSKTIDITFSSDYANLIKFLVDLEKSLRIIDVRSITFGQGTDFSSVYNYKVSLEVYWLKDLQYDEKQ